MSAAGVIPETRAQISLDDWFADTRKDLLKLASEFSLSEEVDTAIALLQAERALMHAQDVMAENGIDGGTPFHLAAKDV